MLIFTLFINNFDTFWKRYQIPANLSL
jgi:hypothetical protein